MNNMACPECGSDKIKRYEGNMDYTDWIGGEPDEQTKNSSKFKCLSCECLFHATSYFVTDKGMEVAKTIDELQKKQ